MTGQCPHPIFTHLPVFLLVFLRLTLHVMTLASRYQSSSQDSAASSLTADKMPHWQDRNPTPERLQPKANASTNRRKRLVRQFSLWVSPDYCSLEGSFTSSKSNTVSALLKSYLVENNLQVMWVIQSLFIFDFFFFFLLASNHEDEDNLPEALAAISSQSTGKSGSTSSLDKQIQPSIYPQVPHIVTHANTP